MVSNQQDLPRLELPLSQAYASDAAAASMFRRKRGRKLIRDVVVRSSSGPLSTDSASDVFYDARPDTPSDSMFSSPCSSHADLTQLDIESEIGSVASLHPNLFPLPGAVTAGQPTVKELPGAVAVPAPAAGNGKDDTKEQVEEEEGGKQWITPRGKHHSGALRCSEASNGLDARVEPQHVQEQRPSNSSKSIAPGKQGTHSRPKPSKQQQQQAPQGAKPRSSRLSHPSHPHHSRSSSSASSGMGGSAVFDPSLPLFAFLQQRQAMPGRPGPPATPAGAAMSQPQPHSRQMHHPFPHPFAHPQQQAFHQQQPSMIQLRTCSAPASPVAARCMLALPTSPPPPLLLPSSTMPMPQQQQEEGGVDEGPDLERLMRVITPHVTLPDNPGDATLADVWQFYELPSLFGVECTTLGGPRGPSTSHFVPFLSAVQLFSPAADDATDADVLIYPRGLESWPAAMRRQYAWAASEHVGERAPLHSRITELCGEEGEGHRLVATKLRDVHPYSWFAVAWYPLYRIPDAPLTARFLTFHSLAPLWEAACQATSDGAAALSQDGGDGGESGASVDVHLPSKLSYKSVLETASSSPPGSDGPRIRAGRIAKPRQLDGFATPTEMWSFPPSPAGSDTGTATATTASSKRDSCPSDTASVTASFGSSAPPSPAASDAGDDPDAAPSACPPGDAGDAPKVELPVLGLLWHAPGKGENWVDTLTEVVLPPGQGALPGEPVRGGGWVGGVYGDRAVVRKPYPLAKGGPMSWDIQLEELEEGAARLALAHDLIGSAPAAGGNGGCCCPDYDFFTSRR